jgi:hypothetical protein
MRDPETAKAPAAEVWTGRATNRAQWLLATFGVGCLALGIVLAAGAAWEQAGPPLVMSVIGCLGVGLLSLFGTLAFVHVRVRVDPEALEVRCGHAGLPRRRIMLGEVVGAEVVQGVCPRQWGGWGYRWRPGKGTAVVVRRGEGVALRMGDGRTFTITVDDAESAVRHIRHCLERHHQLS